MNADNFQLSAQKREPSRANNRDLENSGRVLGVVYGFTVDPTPVSVDASEVLRVYRKVGTSGLVDLDLDGKKVKVIMKEVNIHPVKHTIAHVDFVAVNMKASTTVTVPVEFVGEAAGVKDHGGLFMTEHSEIEVKCLPDDIPSHFKMDITPMAEIGSHLTVADLKLDSEKFEVSLDPDTMICSVVAPKIVEEAPTEGEGEGAEGAEATEGDAAEETEGSGGEKNEK